MTNAADPLVLKERSVDVTILRHGGQASAPLLGWFSLGP